MPKTSENLLQACQTLFGIAAPLQEDFLARLRADRAKSVYRNQVKEHHPDLYEKAPMHIRKCQTDRFRDIHRAYRVIEEFLAERQKLATRPTDAPEPAASQSGDTRPTGRQQSISRPATENQGSRIPNIPLEFGMFAYYSGKIAYADLMRGLAWQRRQRPTIGALARQWGWLDDHQVRRILDHHGPSRRFGRKAVELRFLERSQVERLLAFQRARQQRLGEIFVRRRLLSPHEADDLARRLEGHNARVREVLSASP